MSNTHYPENKYSTTIYVLSNINEGQHDGMSKNPLYLININLFIWWYEQHDGQNNNNNKKNINAHI